jgi:hypothetical protein
MKVETAWMLIDPVAGRADRALPSDLRREGVLRGRLSGVARACLRGGGGLGRLQGATEADFVRAACLLGASSALDVVPRTVVCCCPRVQEVQEVQEVVLWTVHREGPDRDRKGAPGFLIGACAEKHVGPALLSISSSSGEDAMGKLEAVCSTCIRWVPPGKVC